MSSDVVSTVLFTVDLSLNVSKKWFFVGLECGVDKDIVFAKQGKENFIVYGAMAFMAYLIVLRDGFSPLPPAGMRMAMC